jgi:dihydroorotate dehydrogenase
MHDAANRMASARLRGLRIPVGINLGPNRDTPVEHVTADYTALMAVLSPVADFVVINLSSPNTAGLRDWQAPERLRTLVAAIRPEPAAGTPTDYRCPVLIKLAPDLELSKLAELCDLIIELKLDGIVATNSTLAREDCGVTSAYEGGLSGEPLKLRARSIIREIYQRTDGRIPIIGVGGVSTTEDAYEHIRAGASLVELYTALVYDGPRVVRRIKQGLLKLLQRDRVNSISEAVGTAARKN